MLPTLLLAIFMLFTVHIRKQSIRLIRKGRIHGMLTLTLAKICFWLAMVQLVGFWWPAGLTYVLPVIMILFLLYFFIDRRFYHPNATKKFTQG